MHIFWFNGKQITILPLSFVLQCRIYYYGRKSNIHVSLFYLDEKGSVRVILKLCMKETMKRFSCKRLSDSKACSNFILGGSDKNNSHYLSQLSLINWAECIYQIWDVVVSACNVYFIFCFSLFFKFYSLIKFLLLIFPLFNCVPVSFPYLPPIDILYFVVVCLLLVVPFPGPRHPTYIALLFSWYSLFILFGGYFSEILSVPISFSFKSFFAHKH